MDLHLKLGGLMGASPYSNLSILDAAELHQLQQHRRNIRHYNQILYTPQQLQHTYQYQQEKPTPANNVKFDIPDYVIQDLICRFIANIPDEEKFDPVRALFQIELAHWFFIDHYCGEDGDPKLFGMGHIPFNHFAHILFKNTPHLKQFHPEVDKYVAEFRDYRSRVPTFGAILMNDELNQVLLVQGFRNQWGFPKGKVNEVEDPVDCAIREVFEETGYDMTPLINPNHYIESKTRERNDRLYLVRGVDVKFPFYPQTQYEIKHITWFNLDELPEHKKDTNPKILRHGQPVSNFFTIYPYMKRLKVWVTDKLEGRNKIECFRSRWFDSDKDEAENFMNFNTSTGGTGKTSGTGAQYNYETTTQCPNPTKNVRSGTPGQEILRSVQGGHGLPNAAVSVSSSHTYKQDMQFSGIKGQQQQQPQENISAKKSGKELKSKKRLFSSGPQNQNASSVISHMAERKKQSTITHSSQLRNKPSYLDNFNLSAPSWQNFKLDRDRILRACRGESLV